jgi:serine/threonine protein kinase
MNPTDARAEAIFQAAVLLSGDAEREALIGAECRDDLALEMRVRRLLREHEEADNSGDGVAPSPEIEAELARLKPEESGETIGPYKLREQVGEGGFGTVWVADQELPVKRRVALKIIKLGMNTREVIARFEQERQALAMMDHPNIARVLDAGATQFGRPFFVMELVRGIPITDYCDQANLSTVQRLDLFIQVCQAVQHAHQKGIIHRDLKPSNILITLQDGVPVPKVIDFGIAKATEGRLTDSTIYTQMHQLVGTPAYMSPEQAEMSGLDIDTRSDIYSLGVLLYELLAGSTPFDAQELMASGIDAMRKTIREKEPVRPSTKLATLKGDELMTTARRRSVATSKLANLLRGDLDWIVMKCLEKDRSRRYDTANGLAADLKRHLNNEPVVARPPSAAYRLQKSFRRNKLVFTSAMAVAAALLFGMFVSVWQAVRATHAEREQTHLREAADKARQQAEAAQTSETRLRKLAQLQAYAADMKAAQVALQQNSRQQAATLLDQYWPNPGEPDLRGVEWRYLWQAARGDEIYTWEHPGMVAGALFSPDGKQVATACFDGVLRIWNVASGKCVAEFDRGVSDESVLLSFCFAPDGATLASASREGIVLLDCATWGVKRTLEMAEDERPGLPRISLIYSPDGRWLAASLHRRRIRLWNTASWESFTLPAASDGGLVSPRTARLWQFVQMASSNCGMSRRGRRRTFLTATLRLGFWQSSPRNGIGSSRLVF